MANQELVPFKPNNLVIADPDYQQWVARVVYEPLDDSHYEFKYSPDDNVEINMIESSRPTEENEFIDVDFEPGMRDKDKPYYLAAATIGLMTGAMSELGLDVKLLKKINEWDPKEIKKMVVKVAKLAGCKDKSYKAACAFLREGAVVQIQHHVPNELSVFGREFLAELANHPSLAGLAFSIATQFSKKKYTLEEDGTIKKTKVPKYYVIGKNVEEKFFFGLFYWMFGLAYSSWASKRMILEELKVPKAILEIIKEFCKSKWIELVLKTDNPEEWISGWLKEAFLENNTKSKLAEVDETIKDFDLENEIADILKAEYAHFTMVLLNECLLRGFYFIYKVVLEVRRLDLSSPEQVLELDYTSLVPSNNRVVTRMSVISSVVYLGVNVATTTVKLIETAASGEHNYADVLITGINVAGIGYFAYACVADKDNLVSDVKVSLERVTEWGKAKFQRHANMDERILLEDVGDVFSVLGLSTDATRLLYSLEAKAVEYDVRKSKKNAELKFDWLQAWKEQMSESLRAEEGYFIEDDNLLYEAIYDAVKDKENHSWLYLIAMELALFEPYSPLGNENDREWKKLSFEANYLEDVFIRKQTLLTQDEADAIIKKYKKYYGSVSGSTQKKVIQAGATAFGTVLVGTLAYFFAPAIAVALAGEAVVGLHGAALTSASLAWAGFGSLASGGLGMAGGTAIISGGGALLGLAGGGGTSALATAMLQNSGKYVYRQAAKLLTYSDCVLNSLIQDKEAIRKLEHAVDVTARQTEDQLDELKAFKDDLQKDTIKGLEAYVDCLERTEKGLEAFA